MMTAPNLPTGWVRDPNSRALVFADTETLAERMDRLEQMIADVNRRLDRLENREVVA